MKSILKIFLALIVAIVMSLVVQSVTGLGFGSVLLGILFFSIILSIVPKEKNALQSVFLLEAFIEELKEAIVKAVDNSFLRNAQNYSNLVENNVIKWNKIGARPDVVIGSVTFPLTPTNRVDDKDSIDLYPFRTLPTSIPLEELHALPYDKKSTVFKQHKEAQIEKYLKYALHSFAPDVNTTDTPVVETTGADDGTGRKRLTVKDLIDFRLKLQLLGISECDLVLSPYHVADLQLADQAFAMQYHNITTGQIVNMYGFNIVQGIGYCPYYDNTTKNKNALEAVINTNDRDASIVIIKKTAFYAQGSVEVLYAEPEPRYQQHEISTICYNTSGLFDKKGSAAIISGRV